jgi:hypothetical protein
MIAVILADLRWRVALLLPLAGVLYALEPGFHQHEEFSPDAIALGPLGISAALAHFAGVAMIVLLTGFVSADRRYGYTRLLFSHPTSPLGYYGLRWLIAYGIALLGATIFLVFGQLIAWGTFRGGLPGLLLPALTALVYGGLIAFFSVSLRRGDAWITFLLFLPTFFPELLELALSSATAPTRRLVGFLLPPQAAIAQVWEGLILGSFAGTAALYAAGYGLAFLAAAVAVVRVREWP